MPKKICLHSELLSYVKKKLKGLYKRSEFKFDEVCFVVESTSLVKFVTSLRDDPKLHFSQLMDITAVDYPEHAARFQVVYQFLSVENNLRLRVKVNVKEGALVPSLMSEFSTANWFEREVWDMFGIAFKKHRDLRRILSDYGFKGHPLRKDFPLTGHVEVRYDALQEKVVYEPVKLVQDFRMFDFLSPWEGMTDIMLPGDEKAKYDDKGNA